MTIPLGALLVFIGCVVITGTFVFIVWCFMTGRWTMSPRPKKDEPARVNPPDDRHAKKSVGKPVEPVEDRAPSAAHVS